MTFLKSEISEQEAKVFVLSAVGLSAGVFNVAFWYGVFETVFFEQLFYVWVASTVALAASMLVPQFRKLPALVTWRGRFVLVLPTLWLLLEAITSPSASVSTLDDWLLWAVSVAAALLTLPYLIYVLVVITIPDIESLRTPALRSALFGFAAVVAVLGVAIGKNHPLFLTCSDFKVAGSDVPDNCRNAPSYLTPKS